MARREKQEGLFICEDLALATLKKQALAKLEFYGVCDVALQ